MVLWRGDRRGGAGLFFIVAVCRRLSAAAFGVLPWLAGPAFGAPSLGATGPNPAMMMFAQPGLTTEVNVTTLFGTTVINPVSVTNPSIPGLAGFGGSGNMNRPLTVPVSYAAYRFKDWAIGLATGSPYVLQTLPNRPWAGMVYATDSKIFTENFTPQIAFRLNDRINLGAGFQIQHMHADLSFAFQQSPGFADLNYTANALSYGYTLGATFMLTPRTVLGVGYRSKLDQKLEGTVSRGPVPIAAQPAVALPGTLTFPMPDSVTVNVAHQVDAAWAVFGLVTWSRWSRFGTLPAIVSPPGVYGIPTALNFHWRDTWSYSGGVEYRWRPNLVTRAGLRYDQAPSMDGTRTLSSPTANTIRSVLGFTYDITNKLSLDLNYVHNFVRHVPIDIVPGHPGFTAFQGTFVGEATLAADYISVGLRYYWGPLGK
jgi:long-chain fatty acid transport protein